MNFVKFKDPESNLYVIATNAEFIEVIEWLNKKMKGRKYLGMECLGKDISKLRFEDKDFYYNSRTRCLLEFR